MTNYVESEIIIGIGNGPHMQNSQSLNENLYTEAEKETEAMLFLNNFKLDITLNRGVSDVTYIDSRNASKKLTNEIDYLCKQMEAK
ncbi:MAG: hypothetical protein KJ697_01095 [Nanoarchaeota archaeon]|nr:hypothetical protein [Nanoarchaeota archaeon]